VSCTLYTIDTEGQHDIAKHMEALEAEMLASMLRLPCTCGSSCLAVSSDKSVLTRKQHEVQVSLL